MKKIDLGQAVTILANVGVIAGIVFLAVELQQNNELMGAAARAAQNERIQDFVEQRYTVPGLAEILIKARDGEPLTEVEELKLFSRQLRMLRGFEAQYREYSEGTVEVIPSDWTTYFYEGGLREPPLIGVWDEAKTLLSQEFVQYVDENVVDQ